MYSCFDCLIGNLTDNLLLVVSSHTRINTCRDQAFFFNFTQRRLFVTMMTQLMATSLFVIEALHALVHTNVLLATGKTFSVQELEKKRSYFIFDAGSVLLSLF